MWTDLNQSLDFLGDGIHAPSNTDECQRRVPGHAWARCTFSTAGGTDICGVQSQGFPLLVIQVSGALYLGFANLNWMARGVLIGGIYSRPLAMGNFLHFSIVTIVLAKTLSATTLFPLVACGIAYAIFAVWFGLMSLHIHSPIPLVMQKAWVSDFHQAANCDLKNDRQA